ncbi:MAG: WG repeat-containing protein [Clostridium sp.]
MVLKKKLISLGVAAILGMSSLAGLVPAQVVQAKAAVSVKTVEGKITSLITSLKKGVINEKSISSWKASEGEIIKLMAKLPKGKDKNRLQGKVNICSAVINVAAKVNQLEKSIASNGKNIGNAEVWNKSIAEINKLASSISSEFASKKSEIQGKLASAKKQCDGIISKHHKDLDEATKLYNKAAESKNKEEVEKLIEVTERLASHSSSNGLKEKARALYTQVVGNLADIKILTSPISDTNFVFSEGVASMKNSKGYSYIDNSGKIVMGPFKQFTTKSYVGDDEDGNPIYEKEVLDIEEAGDFHEGYSFLGGYQLGSMIINKSGVKIGENYGGIERYSFMDGIALGWCNPISDPSLYVLDKNMKETDYNIEEILINKYGSTDNGDGEISPKVYWTFESHVTEGLLPIKIEKTIEDDGKWGYLDFKGRKFAIEPKFDEAQIFYNGLAPAKLNGKWGFINTKGEFVIKPQFDDFVVEDYKYKRKTFSEGLESVQKNGKWGAIDKSGNLVIDYKYDEYLLFKDGEALIKKNGKLGIIDIKGVEIIKPTYDDINHFYNGVSLVKKNGVYYFMDKNEKKIGYKTWKFESTYYDGWDEGVVSYKKDGKWGLMKMETTK